MRLNCILSHPWILNWKPLGEMLDVHKTQMSSLFQDHIQCVFMLRLLTRFKCYLWLYFKGLVVANNMDHLIGIFQHRILFFIIFFLPAVPLTWLFLLIIFWRWHGLNINIINALSFIEFYGSKQRWLTRLLYHYCN